ncbi:hypothetical protein ADIS_4617 [Lunatimonas lonarensis]|uniref:Monoheme cytochrome C n=1 Tax=Lunatimonas lonarensis TaxID=1232681 RepID=R7ZLG1_9BACT|nr:hypothetical protein [Lunatimonas lonarensis]EON74923.1 hypothetical protein ADIS_4617 [Lunatimonas lonarensis]
MRQKRLQTRFHPIIVGLGVLLLIFVGYYVFDAVVNEPNDFVAADAPIPLDQIENRVENGVHVATGLLEGDGLNLVIANCTACHSAQLITQNRADREGWKKMIVWMQRTQNLWDMGNQEEVILTYLATHYGPEDPQSSAGFRRAPLKDIDWYELRE